MNFTCLEELSDLERVALFAAMGFATNLEHAFMPDTDRIYARMLELARY